VIVEAMVIVLALAILALTVFAFVWLLQAMLTHACPHCWEERSEEEPVIPIVPTRLWWCPSCNRTIANEQIRTRHTEQGEPPAATRDEEEIAKPRF
jgi:hypothetical protein